jgi:hypothetical protein
MSPARSALRLPRYTVRKPLKGAWGYFFHIPGWARAAGCPVKNEPLGTDYAAAVQRAETVLLPAFDAWRRGAVQGDIDVTPARTGTLDWLFAEYRADRRFTRLDTRTKRNHEVGFRLVGGYVLKDGRRLGERRLSDITTAVVDDLYGRLLIIRETDTAGNVIERERRTTVNHAMKTCRRAWNIASRRNPGKVPLANPFSQMGLIASDRDTPTATLEELQAFRAKAVEMGLPSLATAALIAWEWLPREKDIFATFDVKHYRPKDRPQSVYISDGKTDQPSWVPLYDANKAPLYPELMAELDALKRTRITGLMLCRDWGDRAPWPTWPKRDEVDLTHMARKVKEVVRATGLRDELTFASFRHGGFTEAGDAGLSDRQIMAQGRHASPKVLKHYVKKTERQVAEGTQLRRASRTKGGPLSE